MPATAGTERPQLREASLLLRFPVMFSLIFLLFNYYCSFESRKKKKKESGEKKSSSEVITLWEESLDPVHGVNVWIIHMPKAAAVILTTIHMLRS